MRGIYPTSIPEDGDYSPLQLGKDCLALIEAFGEHSAFVMGHDWGAMSAYAAANLDGAAIKRMSTIAIPHPRAIRPNMRLMRRGWHFGFLAIPVVAEVVARWNNFALLDHFERVWSPGMRPDPKLRDSFKRAYGEPGSLKAALGYYRSLSLTFAGVGGHRRHDREILLRKTAVPTLCFAGNQDGVFDESVFDRTPEAFTGFYELVKMPHVGHFPHLERPEEFVEKTLEFFREARS
jgi:pimeloyl-ACP methyl ester carboxylesterase